jgi:hypothetical protein
MRTINNILDDVETESEMAATAIKFEISCCIGEDESDDEFCASFPTLSVSCFGPTKELAVESARKSAAGKLLTSPRIRKELLSLYQSKISKSKSS